LCGGEEHGLTFVLGQDLDDLAHFILESDFENTVSLIDDQSLQVLEDKSLRVLQVIQQTTGSRNEQVDTLHQLVGLGTAVGTSDDNTVCLRVVGHEFAGDTEDLQGQFTGRGHDENTGT
jgi:hypothetical protein